MNQPVRADRLATYTQLIERERDTLEELSVRIAEGQSLAAVCEAWGVPFGRFAAWIAADPSRQDLYDGARRLRADFEADQSIVIADEGGGDTPHAALRVKARQWAASRWDRGRYGDSMQVQHTGETVVRLSFGGVEAAPVPALVGSSSAAEDDGSI